MGGIINIKQQISVLWQQKEKVSTVGVYGKQSLRAMMDERKIKDVGRDNTEDEITFDF